LVAAAEPIISSGIAALLAGEDSAPPPPPTLPPTFSHVSHDSPTDHVTVGITAAHGRAFIVLDAVATVDAAERALATYRPPLSVLVLDPPLPGGTVDDACARLISDNPSTAALVLLVRPEATLVRRACRSGARAVFGTDIRADELSAVLRQIDEGEVVIQPPLVRFLVGDQAGSAHAATETLTLNNRELTALQLLARGYTSKQIAPLLNSSAKAVDMTIERASRRLGAATRSQAVAIALRHGLIT
jgi:DNA-binding NarL/FixJ family response regulator